MSMSEWAKNEVQIACKREAPDRAEGEWDYGCACYESALKAYLSLMEDGHSGMSFSFTAGILKRLLESKPLTPIDDVPEVWAELVYQNDKGKHYQCKRMGSLFKDIAEDGSVSYHDNERYHCKDEESGITYTCSLESRLLDELHPITMPYFPPVGSYVFTTKELLTDRKNGDFDTKAIYALKTPDGTVEQINRFYKESPTGWEEIDVHEYLMRATAHKLREKREAASHEEERRTGRNGGEKRMKTCNWHTPDKTGKYTSVVFKNPGGEQAIDMFLYGGKITIIMEQENAEIAQMNFPINYCPMCGEKIRREAEQ